MYDEEISLESNVRMQFIISDYIVETYGISFKQLSKIFDKYDAYHFVEDNFWELNENGVEDAAYEFLAHMCLSGGSMEEIHGTACKDDY